MSTVDHRPGVLICTMGFPRSGKSTWARKTGHPIVCPDAIRVALHGHTYWPPAEPMVWATAWTMVESLFQAGHRTVVFDSTAISWDRREEIRRHGQRRIDDPTSRGWTCEFAHIDTDAGICVSRAMNEGRHDLCPVIGRMEEQFMPLGEDETRHPILNGGAS